MIKKSKESQTVKKKKKSSPDNIAIPSPGAS